jgi:hypothetical protein
MNTPPDKRLTGRITPERTPVRDISRTTCGEK